MPDMFTKHYAHLPLIALCFCCFLVIIDATIVNVALPIIARDLKGSIVDLQWIIAGYTLTFACLLLSSGTLGDKIGAKLTVLLGLSLFLSSSLSCALAYNFILLTGSRLVQGVGAAMLLPNAVGLIHLSYENSHDRAKAFGIWSGVGGLAAATGPVLGAILTSGFGWRSIFFINIPIGILGFFFIFHHVFPKKDTQYKKFQFDLKGLFFSTLSMASLALALIEANRLGFTSLLVLGCFVMSSITFILFLRVEQKTKYPMLPLSFFTIKNFSISICIGMILYVGISGELFILPLYFERIRGYSVLETGFALMPTTGIAALISYLSGKLSSRAGFKQPMLLGLFVGLLGFLGLLMIKQDGPIYWALLLPLLAVGFGISFTLPATTIAAIFSIPEHRVASASGALSTTRQIGSLLGVAIFGTIVSDLPFIQGLHLTLFIISFIFLLGILLVLIGIKNELYKEFSIKT
jgi:DHA2 family methylenomycin A resistance protein-like MFS transporter